MDASTIRTIIFDLGEVLIGGLYGIERPLAERLAIAEEKVLQGFAGRHLKDFCCGRITEDEYLEGIIERQGWFLQLGELKDAIRVNLQQRVPGMDSILRGLDSRHQLVIHSDHAREWVSYVRAVHPFLERFERAFFSFELGHTKDEPEAFRKVLTALGRQPRECLFIDDQERNVRAAKSVGLATILFVDPVQLVYALEKRSIRRVENACELE
jgi:HAD superfamily hydrolase (TIGR01509 family)